MSTLLTKIAADFTTQLATAISVGGTTATLLSQTDDDGVTLPDGNYSFTLDGASSNKEHIRCVKTGTSLTSIQSLSRQGALTSGVARAHRIGCSVVITDWAQLKYLTDLLTGATNLDSSVPLTYDGTASITTANQLATKAYADALAIAGAPDSSTTVKGIGRVSVAPVSPTIPIFVGDNDGRVPTQGENDALVGNNTDIAVGTGNKFVTQTGLQKNAEKYAADAGSNDTYVITLSPAPTSYSNGMVIHFKANTVNTGAATINVNGLGAKTIVKGVNTALSNGDILAGQLCTLIYDGTNMVLQSPVATNTVISSTFANGTTTKNAADSSATQTIAHGLGVIPKFIKITALLNGVNANGYSPQFLYSLTTYNGTTQSSMSLVGTTNTASTITTDFRLGAQSGDSNTTAYSSGVTTVDSTNISIAWTKVGGGQGTYTLLWEAQG